MYIVKK